jgi:hypothetical protein
MPGIVGSHMGAKSAGVKHAAISYLFIGFLRQRLQEQLDATASLFDLFDRSLGGAGYFESNLCLQFAVRKDANAVLGAADHAGCLERIKASHRCLGVELACIDRGLDTAERYGEALCEDVVEAALRQATVDWHLAAFEAVDGDARTGLLTLYTATTGLAGARTDTATYALAFFGGAFVVFAFR